MKRSLQSLLLFSIIALMASCSSSLNTLQSNKDISGTDEYAALEQPIPPAPETDALAQADDEVVTKKNRNWGKKAKGLFAGLALKKTAKKLLPKDNLASEKGQKASLLQILLLVLLILLIVALIQVVFGDFFYTLISLALLILLILLILKLLGEI